MLKSEFIQNELKQNNVSKSAEKTMKRLRAIWQPLATPKREEILSLVGLKKTAIERAYKMGNVSAKIVVAVSQVLDIDPFYIAGFSDEERPFDDALVVEFLTELGYEIGKGDVTKKRKTKQKEELPLDTVPADDSENDDASEVSQIVNQKQPPIHQIPADSGNFNDLPAILSGLYKVFGGNIQGRLEEITEEDISLMLKSLSIQAGFSDDKKNRLALIKCILLL